MRRSATPRLRSILTSERTWRLSSPATGIHGIRHPGSSPRLVITAERKSLSVPGLLEAIRTAYGEIELSLCPVTVAELVHGVYRARAPEASRRRRAYIDELVKLTPLHPVTLETAHLVGQIEGQEAARGNVPPFNDLLIAAAAIEQGYAVLTENLRHFEKIPGIRVLGL